MDLYQTWTYTLLPIGQKAISCKWVFRVKYYLDGLIERYKARLVAQRFSQVHGINYTETFAPIVRHKSLRIFLAIAAMLKMILIQIDIVGEYLESVFDQKKYPIFIRILQRCLIN